MTCPSIEDLLAGHQDAHADSCAGCRAILGRARTPMAPHDSCGNAEALLAARLAGALTADGEQALQRHLDGCSTCTRLAGEIQTPGMADAFHGIAVEVDDFGELLVIASENYIRGEEIGRGGMGRIIRARDRRLGRSVAIKELLDERLRSRFEREARLTARLQHPAIVSVLEAGRWPSGEPFYAMKYVAGKPLDQAIADRGTLLERLALLPSLVTVVEAIAYAHSERVIHRDLKPQNILIGAFGETVVVDWGLAKDLSRPESPEAGAPGASPYRGERTDLTAAGAGTPAYMAPEQGRGDDPDEGVDIFALGATMHHLLAGQAPAGTPLPAEVPPELRDIVGKAMAPARADRYQTAAELGAELRRFQTGQLVSAHRYSIRALARRWLRRHRTALIGLAACAGAIGLFVLARQTVGPLVPKCDRGQDRLADAWDPAVRSAVAQAFVASGRPYATDTLGRVGSALDGYAKRWATMRNEVCEATFVRHEQSEELLDKRMQCLDRRLGELRALTTLFGRAADGKVVDNAVKAVARLDDLAGCADAEALAAAVPPPAGPAQRVAVASLRALLNEAQALSLVGNYQPARAISAAIVDAARQVGYAPLELDAIFELQASLAPLGRWKEMESSLRRRFALATELKDDLQLARSWITLITVLYSTDRARDALVLVQVADVAIARAGNPVALRARLLEDTSRVSQELSDYAEAERMARQAIDLLQSQGTVDDIALGSCLNSLGVALKLGGKYAEAGVVYRRALDTWERALGTGHPLVAGVRVNIAALLEREGKYGEALALDGRVLEVFESVFGSEGAELAIVLTNMGSDEIELGHHDSAVRFEQRALAIKEKTAGPNHVKLASSLENLGIAYAHLGRYDEAERMLERARQVRESNGQAQGHPKWAEILTSVALLDQLRGRCRDAVPLEQQAVAQLEKALGKDAPDLVDPLLHLAQCELVLGHAREARPPLDRALAIHEAGGGDPADLAEIQFALAEARWALIPGDRAAVELAEEARAAFALLGPVQKARVPEVERWLAAHRAK